MKMSSTNSRAAVPGNQASTATADTQTNSGFVADYFNGFLGRDPGTGGSTMQDFHFTMQDFHFLPAVQLGALPAVQSGALPAVQSGALPAVQSGALPAVQIDVLPAVQIDVLPAVQIDVLPAVQNFATDWLWG